MDLAFFVFILFSLSLISLLLYFFKMVAEMQPLTALRNYVLKVQYDRKVKSGKIKITEEIVEYDDLPADVQAQIKGRDPNAERPFDPFDRQVASCHLPLEELLQAALEGWAKTQSICSDVQFDWPTKACTLTLKDRKVHWTISIEKSGTMDFCKVTLFPANPQLQESILSRTGESQIKFWDWRFGNTNYAVEEIAKTLHTFSCSYIQDIKAAERQRRKEAKRLSMAKK